jgi:hypothetical protein
MPASLQVLVKMARAMDGLCDEGVDSPFSRAVGLVARRLRLPGANLNSGEFPMILSPLGPASNDGRDESDPPRIPYYSLWTEADGTSRLAACTLGAFQAKSVGGKAAPMWMRAFPGDVAAVFFAVLPVGWVGEWHESPRPQWVVPLSGRWFIEAQDGSRVEMGPGDIHWGQDLGTRVIDGAQGHRSGQIGAEPCVQLMLQFKAPQGSGACPFD